MVHPQRGPPVIPGSRSVEFNLVKQVISEDHHGGDRTQVPGIQPFAAASAQPFNCGRVKAAGWTAQLDYDRLR
jgi:hypothetical protein